MGTRFFLLFPTDGNKQSHGHVRILEKDAKNMNKLFIFITLLLFAAILPTGAKSRLVTVQAPQQGVQLTHDFEVRARAAGGEWQQLSTYAFRVDRVADARHNAETVSVATFEMEGEVEIEVTSLRAPIDSFRIRPLSYKMEATREGNTLRFKLTRPRYLSVEVNGDIYHNLHLFADSVMEKPRVRKRDLIYFGPGVHDFGGDSIAVPSGKTVYIAQGAYIKGWFSVYKASNVRILGHGIVMPGRHEGIMVRYSDDVTIDGPVTTQMPVGASDSVTVRNAKVLSWYGWGDGFNVFASNHVYYNNVFARTSDDCSTIYCTRKDYRGSCRDIRVNGATYWADVAHPIMIGLHGDPSEAETVEDVVYKDIDILEHAENQIDYQGCFGINDGDNILVRGVTFEDIRIENIRRGMLVNLRVCYNKKYCTAPGRGIEDITFRNISYNGRQPNLGIIAGYDDARGIKNIRFENLRLNGRHISDTMEGKPKWYKTADMAHIFVGEHVEGVTFE